MLMMEPENETKAGEEIHIESVLSIIFQRIPAWGLVVLIVVVIFCNRERDHGVWSVAYAKS